jgi:hypothetical protein
MKELFGKYIEKNDSMESIVIIFSSKILSFREHWRNNSLSANFIADYWGTFFLTPGKTAENKMQDVVSFIANELLENAMKFSRTNDASTIEISLSLFEDDLRFYVTNRIGPDRTKEFKTYLNQLLARDPKEFYLEQLENYSEQNSQDVSRLGFLTLLNDYDATLGWKFETSDCPETITVTTMAQWPIIQEE